MPEKHLIDTVMMTEGASSSNEAHHAGQSHGGATVTGLGPQYVTGRAEYRFLDDAPHASEARRSIRRHT